MDLFMWTAYLVSLYFSIFLLLVFLDKKSLFKEQSTILLKRYPFISILVPAYNEEETILETLQSIYHLDYPKEKMEVIVINDGSTDATGSVVASYIQDNADRAYFRIISQRNCGKAAALNRGLQQLKGEFFACLDADSFVERSTLRKMVAQYEQEDDLSLAIVTPAMKVAKPENLLQKIQWLEYIVMIFFGRLSSSLDSLYVAPGPFSLYRTSIIKQLQGFDETTLTEDQEIAYRVQQHQYRIMQCFDGYVYTTAPKKLKAFYAQRRRWYLGSISCLHQYRGMIGRRRYGDFGVMQLVKSTLGFILAVTGLGVAGYLLLLPVVNKLKNLFLIHFNILPYLFNFKINFTALSLLLINFHKTFILLLLMLLGGFFFYYAHQNAKEKMLRFGWIPLLPYAVFYYLLKSGILVLSLVEFSRRKKIKW